MTFETWLQSTQMALRFVTGYASGEGT